MQVQTINSTLFTQPIQSETGAPILSLNPVPPSNVVAAFNIPKDGQRPEDKHPKNKNPYQTVAEENESKDVKELPESFKLILASDFSELFKTFLDLHGAKINEVQRLFRVSNGVRDQKLYSSMYQKLPELRERRQKQSEAVLMYHYQRPGSRFTGKM